VAVTKVTRDSSIQGDAVPPLLVNHTAVWHGDGQRFDRDPHLRMLGQL
jgi:alpha-ketoglutarate-dependent taurine dioxygenase